MTDGWIDVHMDGWMDRQTDTIKKTLSPPNQSLTGREILMSPCSKKSINDNLFKWNYSKTCL